MPYNMGACSTDAQDVTQLHQWQTWVTESLARSKLSWNVQVLAKALEVWGLDLEPLDAPNMRESAQQPEQEDAFICNLQVYLPPACLQLVLTSCSAQCLACIPMPC